MSTVILALETATEACSAALWHDGAVCQRWELAPRRHAELLLPQCEAVLAEAGMARSAVDAVAFGRGPGAFTGLRIAAGVAQGLALGLQRPVVPVSSLAALAAGAGRQHGAEHVLAALDARMGEVYWVPCERRPEDTLFRALTAEQVMPPGRVALPADWSDWLAAGTGWAAHGEAMRDAIGRTPTGMAPAALPDARYLLPHGLDGWRRGEVQTASEAQPVYLRDRVTG